MKRFLGLTMLIFSLMACEVTQSQPFSLEFNSDATTVATGANVALNWVVNESQKAESGAYASTGCVLSTELPGQSAELKEVACSVSSEIVTVSQETTFSLSALKDLPNGLVSKSITIKIAEGTTEPPVNPNPNDNTAPFVANELYRVVRGATINVDAREGVLANDRDVDGDTITVKLVSSSAHGTLELNFDGSFTYVHNGSATTTDSFSYVVTDGKADSTTATASITITEPNSTNRVPVANEDKYAFALGGTLSIPEAVGVLFNDTDADSDALSATVVSTTTHGKLSLASNGSFSYEHDGSSNATDSFSYQASDGKTVSATVTVTLLADAEPNIFKRQITSSEDDTEEHADDAGGLPKGTMLPTSPDLDIGDDGSYKYVGLRFTDIDLPRATSIKRAYIQFQVDVEEPSSGDALVDLYLIDEDNAAPFEVTNFHLSNRFWTLKSPQTISAWPTSAAQGEAQRFDATDLVQAALNRDGWASGNAIGFILDNPTDSVRIADSFDGNPSGAATLVIEY